MSSAGSSDQPSCPVDHAARDTWLRAAAAKVEQQQGTPSSKTCDSSSIDQSTQTTTVRPKFASSRLATDRSISSIPRATPAQPANEYAANAQTAAPPTSASGHWVYPSESQFHAALVRKHGVASAPPADTMHAVVPIHNAVNERTWSEILGWEQRGAAVAPAATKDDAALPKLVSFSGDSQKLTPRAWWLGVLGYTRPFDRHDWVVERAGGERVEYVIDFYAGKGAAQGAGQGGMPLSFYLDVRPKLNSWEGVRMRVWRFWGLS